MTPKRVVIVGSDYPENEKWCPHFVGIRTAMNSFGIPWKFVTCRPDFDPHEVISFDPDLIIYCMVDMVKRPDWRKKVKKALPKARIVMWYGDLRDQRTTQINSNCSDIDCLFISNDDQEEFYERMWRIPLIKFLPLGCQPIDQPQVDSNYAFPFVFIGSIRFNGAFRVRAREIEEFMDKTGLKIINSADPTIRSRIYRAMPKIYSSSIISLDISHFTDVYKYTSIRYWEIPAYYGFALTRRWPGCEDFYPTDTRAYFDNFDEAVDLIKYYSTHEKERKTIVEAAHKLSYNHTYQKRLNRLFGMV